ncbi:hypothetical protein N0V83_007154 [Neocucurbitaria cava]|uniref:Uncharacterized protein n=1 Tax=Neocucurbitaria cava TaxID=798079 RepID=A0A9W8Y5R8_9PLEO|nr:hypothetical protein N0V83_007154 [Neocucurbitaria cava]
MQDTIPSSDTSTRGDVLFQDLGPIKLLKDLRILHLYRHPMQRVAAVDAHQFAIRFFQTIHLHCPFLNVLILGSCDTSSDDEIHTDLDMLNDAGVAIKGTSQYRYVKREETLIDGQVQMTAVAVSLSQLRDEFPHLEMLNYDPGHQLLERVFHQQY